MGLASIDGAENLRRETIELDEYHEKAHLNLSSVFMLREDYTSAHEALLQHLSMHPESTLGWNNLGVLYMRVE